MCLCMKINMILHFWQMWFLVFFCWAREGWRTLLRQILKAMSTAVVFIKWCHSNSITTVCLGQRQGLKGELHFHARLAQKLLPVVPFWKIQELRPMQQEKMTKERKSERLHLVEGTWRIVEIIESVVNWQSASRTWEFYFLEGELN